MIIETVYRELTEPQPYDWARERLNETMSLFGLSSETKPTARRRQP